MKKMVVSEIDIVSGTIDCPKGFEIDRDRIKNDIITSFINKKRISNNEKDFAYTDYKIPFSQPLQWLKDYLRDHFRLTHGKTLIPTPVDSIRGIIQQQGDVVNTHHNVKDWHLEESPDVSCLYCVGTGEKNSKMIFEYDDGRNKHRRWKEPLEENQFILFSSSLNRYITANDNKDFLVNLSCHYQLI